MISTKTMSDYIVRLFHRYNTTKELVSKLELATVLYRYVGWLIYDYSRNQDESGVGAAELADLLNNVANSLIELSEKEVKEGE